jgi:hydrogenase nickel incorporation protein HypA/HybF
VARITLELGPLAGVAPRALRAAFPLAAIGTCCEGAELVIKISVVRVSCRACGTVTEVRPNRLLCASCGTWRVAVVAGSEMRIESLDLLHGQAEITHV